MKIVYKHLIDFIPSKPSIDDVSKKFFQLGHEHEIIEDNIFDMELTPNRGDCLSINGLLRDLAVFFEVKLADEIYQKEFKTLKLDFVNNAPEACSHIAFLKVDIEESIGSYKGCLKNYFNDLNLNKNNFFTDVSNYISYETGQPTHCYDSTKINEKFILEKNNEKYQFKTLLGKKIQLEGQSLKFIQDGSVINLAGVVGGQNTSCTKGTRSVIVECAFFNPEDIVGQSIKYDINSDAAHKFERGVDPFCHEQILRRFVKIVEDHAVIKNVEIFQKDYIDRALFSIPFDQEIINNILGTSINEKEIEEYLLKLGFNVLDNEIIVPSFRSDIKTLNDIAEEIARVIGYNNIVAESFKIPEIAFEKNNKHLFELNLKNLLIEQGFFEVINNPFVSVKETNSIKLDNPLDSNKKYLRTNLKHSLVENLLYNERRQKDSLKFFEISNIYNSEDSVNNRTLGIICTGRVGRSYLNFSKKIDANYLLKILEKIPSNNPLNLIEISRNSLDTKSKSKIFYLEIDLNTIKDCEQPLTLNATIKKVANFKKYKSISEYPCSTRDLSFSIKKEEKYYELQELILNFKDDLIKDIFIFDFFINEKKQEIKLAFRFIFQSHVSTITEPEINIVIQKIIDSSTSIESVEIPGL